MTAAVPAQGVVLVPASAALAAAYELGRQGAHVTVLERDAEFGGPAGGFDVESRAPGLVRAAPAVKFRRHGCHSFIRLNTPSGSVRINSIANLHSLPT